jgi:DNA-binding IclR family transcriptional regulator
MSSENGSQKTWRFVTNHTQVLLCIARDPGVRLRDVADVVGITERAVQRIVADLVEASYLERERAGRRNRYIIHRDVEMRHRAQAGREIGELLRLLKLDALDEPSRRTTGATHNSESPP